MNVAQRAVTVREHAGVAIRSQYSFDELARLADACYASGLFEDVKDAAQALVKILKGQELGIPPTAAMAAFDIVRKRLMIKPWAMAALVNSCGYGSYRVAEQTTDHCTLVFSRKFAGRGWTECPPVTYTYAEAQQHGLTKESKHWQVAPAHMLYQRVMGRGAMMYFPELFAGISMPPDDTLVSLEQHDDNLDALYGASASPPPAIASEAPGRVQAPSTRQKDLQVPPPASEGMAGQPDGQSTLFGSTTEMQSTGSPILDQILAVHLAHGKTAIWCAGYVQRLIDKYGVKGTSGLSRSHLAKVLAETRDYYDKQGVDASAKPVSPPSWTIELRGMVDRLKDEDLRNFTLAACERGTITANEVDVLRGKIARVLRAEASRAVDEGEGEDTDTTITAADVQ